MRHTVRQPQLGRLLAHPDISIEKIGISQTRAPAGFHMVNERGMNGRLQGTKPLNILGFLRQERICKGFGTPGGHHAAFNPLPVQHLVEAKTCKNHPDRADQRALICPDMIGSTSQPIAARGRDIFDEGMHGHLLFIRQAPDTGGNQARLHRRTAGRVDDKRHGGRLARKGPVNDRSQPRIIQGVAAGANGARKTDNRHTGRIVQKGDMDAHTQQVSAQASSRNLWLASDSHPRQSVVMIDKLEMFIALAKERHFGRAAETCGVTQPSLSSALRQLEEQLGVQLVFRGSRFQGLTPEGARVLEWARKIVGDVRSMKDEMRTVHAGLSGNLRIGVVPTALPMIADLTGPFTTRHPNVKVTILSSTSTEIQNGIEALELDAGITYLDNEPLGRVAQVPLFSEFYRLLCTAASPLSQRSSVTWAEVAQEPLCLLTADMQNRRIINQHLAEAGARATTMIESNSTIALMSHVKSGAWASVVPMKLAEMFAGQDLVSIPITDPEAEHLVGLITPGATRRRRSCKL